MSEENLNVCTLELAPGYKRAGKIVCTESECARCGWNADVDKARKWYIRRFGLKTGKDGLRRLIIKKGAIQK